MVPLVDPPQIMDKHLQEEVVPLALTKVKKEIKRRKRSHHF